MTQLEKPRELDNQELNTLDKERDIDD